MAGSGGWRLLTPLERIARNSVPEPFSDCRRWTGYISPDGYGRTGYQGKTGVNAHRVVYMEAIGEIPKGMVLDHLCRNRWCVNPHHLEPVTPRENVMRGDTEAYRHSRKTECMHGHPFSEENTYIRPSGHRSCRICKRAAGRISDKKRGWRRG